MSKKNKARSFMEGFQVGQTLAKAYGQASDKAEIGDIMKSTPETSQGFTAQDGEQLAAIANAKDADGKPYYQMSGAEDGKGYQVKANFQAADGAEHAPATIAPQQVTDFRGERTAGTMSDQQLYRQRLNAVADVVTRSDPVQGMRMRSEADRDAREEQRFNMDMKRGERQDRREDRIEADETLLRGIDKEAGDWLNKRLTGPDGQPRAATIDDHLATTQYKAAKYAAAGQGEKAAQAIKEYQAGAFAKIQLQSAEREAALGTTVAAVNAGNLDAAKDFYNKFMPDGAQVTKIERGANGQITIHRESDDGRPMPPHVMKDAGQFTAALATFKDPMAVYNWTQNEFRNNLALKGDARADRADARAGAADGRAAAAFELEKADRLERRDAGMNLYKETNPTATPAQLAAVKAGVLPAVPPKGAWKVEAGDITNLLGTPAVDEKGNPITDPMTGRQQVNRNPKAEAEFFKFMKDNNLTNSDEAMAKFMTRKQGPAAAAPPKKGDVVEGYEFLGGDPKSKSSWRQVSSGAAR